MNSAASAARGVLLTAAAIAIFACGGNSVGPSSPSSLVSSAASAPAAPTWSLAGAIVNAVDGAPIAFARLTFQQLTTTTNEVGAFSLTGPGSFPAQRLVVESNSTLTREAFVSAPGTRNIDVVSTLAPFSDSMYRELAFNGFENPSLRPMFHWTVTPRVYIRTLFDDTREPVPSAYISMVASEIQRVTQQWTGYTFDPEVTTGPDLPPDTTNRITVLFVHPDGAQAHCGSSTVSCAIVGNPSTIWFNVTPGSTPTCFASTAHVAHELGHALGAFHISTVGVMRSGGSSAEKGVPITCQNTVDITPNERLHARVMYSRPTGTVYPDKSPLGFSLNRVQPDGGTLVVD